MYFIELQQISIKNLRKSAESEFYGGFSAENWPKYREIPLFSQTREYLKNTPNPFSRAAKLLLTSNLDQRYFLEVSWEASEGFFKILIFCPFFGHFRPQIILRFWGQSHE